MGVWGTVQNRGGGCSEVEGGLSRRADTKSKYEETGLGQATQAPGGHWQPVGQGTADDKCCLEGRGCGGVGAGVLIGSATVVQFSAHKHFCDCPCLPQNTLGKATLLQSGESEINPVPRLHRLTQASLDPCCSSCHPSGSSWPTSTRALLSPSHSPLCLALETGRSLSSKQANSTPKSQKLEKRLDPSCDHSHFCAPAVSRATSVHTGARRLLFLKYLHSQVPKCSPSPFSTFSFCF